MVYICIFICSFASIARVFLLRKTNFCVFFYCLFSFGRRLEFVPLRGFNVLTAPAPASQKALKLAGMAAKDIDLWEINEAFATVVLQTIRVLDLDPERVNVNGGAIALGHPLGATGAMLLGTAIDELERTGKATALVTLCIGGGQGIATVIERV